MTYDAVVLAGGQGSRLGGVVKADIEIGDRTLLERTLEALGGAQEVVLVGDIITPGVTTVREDPPFGGPAAALGAALPLTSAEWIALVGCDHPFLDLTELFAALGDRAEAGPDGVIGVGPDGRRQHLLVIARREALVRAVTALDQVAGAPLHAIIRQLDLTPVDLDERTTLDLDTVEDVARARALA